MGKKKIFFFFFSNLFLTAVQRIPIFDRLPLNLYALFHAVLARGGLQSVIDRKLWRFIVSDLQVDPDRSDAGFRLRLHYAKYLLDFEQAAVKAEQAVKAGSTADADLALAAYVRMTVEEHQQHVAASVAAARASCSALLGDADDSQLQLETASTAPQGVPAYELAYVTAKQPVARPQRQVSVDVDVAALPRKSLVQAGTVPDAVAAVAVAPKRKLSSASAGSSRVKRAAADSCDDDDDDFAVARPAKQAPDYVTVQKNLNNLAVGRVRPAKVINVAAAADEESSEELTTIQKFLERLRDEFL